MIALTRRNGNALIVNADLILTVEATPETMLYMVNGERIVVKETIEEVVKKSVAFRRRIHFQDLGGGR
jgi:flagellar protein FlbD